MAEFRFLLRNEKRSGYDRISWLIVLINLAALLSTFFSERGIDTKTIVGMIGVGLALAAQFLFHRQARRTGFLLLYSALALAWILQGFYWAALASLLFGFLYWIATRPLQIEFSRAEVSYPSFPRRNLEWSKFANVILKDGVLTLDFRDNRLVQQNVDPVLSPKEEEEFNEFCRRQLER